MRSTSPGPSLRLSFRRAEKTAFWLLAAAIASLLVWLLAALAGAQRPAVWGAVAAAVLLLPGLLSPQYFDLGIRVWNKLMLVLTPALRAYVLRVSYVLLMSAVGRAGSSFHVARPAGERSMWVPRRDGARRAGQRQAWLEDVPWYRAAVAGGGQWIASLMPVVALLRVLRNDELEETPPSATYTLY